MGRKFVRVSLGGVRDEAEIRGHRRTYIGAMPGRLITAMKQAGTINPVILLDEIDKLSADYRGDPASAMLEVLDPEQNHVFVDHFLDLPYDLSQVLFITTANYGSQIPRPLRDRMEIIDVSGYTEEEKVEIGRRHLLRRQIEAHGLKNGTLEIPGRMWRRLVRDYTREAGVRQLDREVAAICRRVARDIVRGKAEKVRLNDARLSEYLGPGRYGQDLHLGESQIGLAIGLGVTEVGGELLPVEVLTMPGKGSLTITGKAGDVMQESARAALSYARSRAEQAPDRPRLPGQARPAHPPAGGRDAEGRPLGRDHDGDGADLRPDAAPGPRRHRDDRRDHAARPGAGDRRAEGEGAGGPPPGHPPAHRPARQRARPAEDPGQRPQGDGDHLRRHRWTR